MCFSLLQVFFAIYFVLHVFMPLIAYNKHAYQIVRMRIATFPSLDFPHPSVFKLIGASLSEPHVVRSTAEICVACLSVDVRTFGEKKCAASIRIRALILHLAGDN